MANREEIAQIEEKIELRGFHYTWTSEVEREAIKEYEKSRGIL